MDKVLVIDDSPELSEICELVLSNAGYQVVTAPDGRQGLEQVRRLHPDVVLLDMMMPEMDGLEFLSQLRALDPRPRVVAYSGFDEFERIALQHGAQAFVRKPFDPKQLLATVEAVQHETGPSEAAIAEQRAHTQAERARAEAQREDLLTHLRTDDPELH